MKLKDRIIVSVYVLVIDGGERWVIRREWHFSGIRICCGEHLIDVTHHIGVSVFSLSLSIRFGLFCRRNDLFEKHGMYVPLSNASVDSDRSMKGDNRRWADEFTWLWPKSVRVIEQARRQIDMKKVVWIDCVWTRCPSEPCLPGSNVLTWLSNASFGWTEVSWWHRRSRVWYA